MAASLLLKKFFFLKKQVTLSFIKSKEFFLMTFVESFCPTYHHFSLFTNLNVQKLKKSFWPIWLTSHSLEKTPSHSTLNSRWIKLAWIGQLEQTAYLVHNYSHTALQNDFEYSLWKNNFKHYVVWFSQNPFKTRINNSKGKTVKEAAISKGDILLRVLQQSVYNNI